MHFLFGDHFDNSPNLFFSLRIDIGQFWDFNKVLIILPPNPADYKPDAFHLMGEAYQGDS